MSTPTSQEQTFTTAAPARPSSLFPWPPTGTPAAAFNSNVLRTQRGSIKHERFNHFAWRFVFTQDPSQPQQPSGWQETAHVLDQLSPPSGTAPASAATTQSPFYAKTIDDFASAAGGAAGTYKDVPSISLFYKSTRAFLTYLREAMEQVRNAYHQHYLPEEGESQIYYSRTVDQYLMKEPYPDTNERHEYKVVVEISSYAGHYNIFLKRYFRIHPADTTGHSSATAVAAAAALDVATAPLQSTDSVGGVDENDGGVMNSVYRDEWKPTKAYYLFSRHDNFEEIENFVVQAMKRENPRLYGKPRKV